MSDPALLAAQTALADLGYDPGPLDGINGPRTKAAVTAFQRDHGLKVDGIIGPQTTEALISAEADKHAGTDTPVIVIPGVPGAPAIPTSSPTDLGPSPLKVAAIAGGVGLGGWLLWRLLRRNKSRR